MPSPFPGMDPWLESPDIWPDFHSAFACGLSTWLNRRLPRPDYARLEMRPELGVVEDKVAVFSEMGNHAFVEIRDPSQGHHLITLIEIVSPSNKNPGPDRESYLQKQAEVLGSDANLIEIDLLRAGKRTFEAPELTSILALAAQKSDYFILVNRASKRADNQSAYQVFANRMTEPLPCIPLPLREGMPQIPVDLQRIFVNVYEDGPYAQGAIDYGKPPATALPPTAAAWAQECLRQAGYA